MTSIVLAGGKSSRLGSNKVMLTVGGTSLIQRVLDRLAGISSEIIVVTANEGETPCAPSNRVRIVTDIYPGKGPLGGIYTGLVAASNPRAAVVGCDMPFLSTALLRYMMRVSPEAEAVIPRLGDNVEPLCAVYSKSCLSAIHDLLMRDELRIRRLLDSVVVRYVERAEIDRHDPERLSFFNVNTQLDLDTAKRLAAESGLAAM